MTRQPKPEFLNPDDFPEPHMERHVSEAERLAQEIDGERYGDVAAELRRLAAVERERNDYLQRLNNLHVNAQKCRADRDRLAAEVSALRADAERYRWLAAHCRSTSEHWGGRWSIIVEGPAPKTHDSEDDFDAAIDAAKAKGAA